MADEVKKVGVEWKVDYKALTALTKEVNKNISALKQLATAIQKAEKEASLMAKRGLSEQAEMTRATAGLLREQEQAVRQYAVVLGEQVRAQTEAMYAVREETAALREGATAQDESTQATKRNTEAKREQTQATQQNTINWYSTIRTLALYGIGAASTYRLIMKLRRALEETIETVFEQTEEYQKMQKAQDNLKGAIIAFLGTDEDWKRYFDTVADYINRIAEGLIYLAAVATGVKTFIEAMSEAKKEGEVKYPGVPGVDAETQNLKNWEAAAEAAQAAIDSFVERFRIGMQEMQAHSDLITEGGEEGEKALEGLTDAQKKYQGYLEDLIQAEEKRIKSLLDLFEDYERKIRDIALETQRAMEDLALAGTRRREDIELAYQRKLEDVEAAAQERRADAEEKYRLKLIQIEMRYRERLIQIEENFQDAMYDAISKRDATAALLAIRKRQRDEGRARRERDDARTLARLGYESQINDQQRALERMREDARRARQRALEDLERDQERERQDILEDQKRKLDDLDMYFDRKQQDIETQYQWEINTARAHYLLDESEWNTHLRNKLTTLQDTYRTMIAEHQLLLGALSQPLPAPGRGTPRKRFQGGGVEFYDQPTMISVGHGTYGEMVIAAPLGPGSAAPVSFQGRMSHQISGQVSAAMAGFEGRLGAAISQQVLRVMGDMLGGG